MSLAIYTNVLGNLEFGGTSKNHSLVIVFTTRIPGLLLESPSCAASVVVPILGESQSLLVAGSFCGAGLNQCDHGHQADHRSDLQQGHGFVVGPAPQNSTQRYQVRNHPREERPLLQDQPVEHPVCQSCSNCSQQDDGPNGPPGKFRSNRGICWVDKADGDQAQARPQER